MGEVWRRLTSAAVGAAAVAMLATPALADDAPAAAPQLQPICADRPTKANGPCTVDVGHFQVEADIVNATFMRAGGVSTDDWLIFNPTLKFGLTANLDIEASIAPVDIQRVRGGQGAASTQTGIGDLYLRAKYEFVNKPSFQAALMPYVKAPTASRGLGNGAVEGGLLLPVNVKLTSALSLALQPEVDSFANGAGDGHHLATSQDVNLGLSLPHNVTVFAELWGQWDFDPAGTVRQYSADIAAALGLGRDTQLDAGVNFGLNRATPALNPYIGIAHRF
jgi:hypothetical protein